MIVRIARVLLLLAALRCVVVCRTFTVCEVLNRLSELNGKEVTVRGVWLHGDNGEDLWASPACDSPVVRDGWLWKSFINIGPSDLFRFRDLYMQEDKLRHSPEPLKIMVTLTGILRTKDHFKINRSSRLPIGYGYDVAGLVFSEARDLQAVAYDPSERERLQEDCREPFPIRLQKR